MSRSTDAGPSTVPAAPPKEVQLSVEPVHIYTDPDPYPSNSTGAAHTILDAFERERKLQDITADGTNVFATRKPASVQLGEDVRRLWAERGDFSRFRTSQLMRGKREREQESVASSSDDDEEDGADMEGKGKGKGEEDADAAAGLLRRSGEKVGGTIAESEFVAMRNAVLANLDVAHFNSIHAHQLLGMLIKQHRSATSTSTTTAAAGRMGSPAPSVGGQSARSGSTTTAAAPKAPLGIFSHLATAREEEFVLDPLAIALSRTSLASTTTAVRRTLADANADADSDDEYAADPTSAAYGLKQAQREIEAAPGFAEAQLREFKVVLETKRKAIANAAELLSSAAGELRAGQGANRERWRALIGLHARGWRMTPGRPLLDVERFGVSTGEEEEVDVDEGDADKADPAAANGEEAGEAKTAKGGKKQGGEKKTTAAAGLQGFGTPIITSDGKVKEEGARDAWIGFGLPEAPIELRRRSLAYWADSASSSTNTTADEIKHKLVFPDRMHRRLRVRFVLWPPSSSGPEQQQKDEKRLEWCSDPTSSSGTTGKEDGPVVVGAVLDEELQDASREATDELVFGDVVAQARKLPPSFGVRLTATSVRIVLTKRLDLVVELVATSSSASETEAPRYAPHAALLLAFLRMGPLRKYQAFALAVDLARRSDAPARAAALKAAALGAPKKSTANASTGTSAKGGIAAGGTATSHALRRLDTLGPVLVGLHYCSFVHRLGSMLSHVQQRASHTDSRVTVHLVPLDTGASPAHLTHALSRIVDGVASASTQAPAADTLHGHARVYVQAGGQARRLLCTLTFAQPSVLSVQFAAGARGGSAQSRVRLTTKPLAVDVDTLRALLVQQLEL
ncbi:conserved hypothetical protein [Sporisorium reilianum SRZ2]|uniref:Mediator of RNA polymerase II transcription subunit 17 n=1 Tax=Sporisorium reilianum (strain SRZ2) TaxID=999809 RepID=E6ZPX3_SPORE|nr:conserved hypothetical protein [Sporisorium reilianum SRZ2]